jgi:hypothetical protein
MTSDDQIQSLRERVHNLRPPVVEEQPPAPSPQILDLQRRYQELLVSRGRQPDVEQSYVSPWAQELAAAKAKLEAYRNSPKVYPPLISHESQSEDNRVEEGNCLQSENEDSTITKKKRRSPFSEDLPILGGYGRKWRKRIALTGASRLNSPAANAKRRNTLDYQIHCRQIEKEDAQREKDNTLERSGGLLTRNEKGKILYRTPGPERQRRSDSLRDFRALGLYLDWLSGRHSTTHLPLPFPELDYREKDSLRFRKLQKRSHMTALYFEHIEEKDPLYVDEHANILPHTPDWAILLDGQVCLVELERTTLSQQLWYAIRKEKLPQFKVLRKELMSIILRFHISALRYRHVEGSPLSVILAKPELKESLHLHKGEDGKIEDATLFHHFCYSTEKYLDHIEKVLAFHFPAEHSFLTAVINAFDELSDSHDKLTEEELLFLVTQVIQKVREEQNFQDDVLTIQNQLWHLHFKATYSDSSRLSTKHLKYGRIPVMNN